MEYLLHVFILICVYVILASSLNLIAGYAGVLSLAHAAFFGVGAYVAALLSLNFGTSLPVNIICAATLCGLCGALVGIPSLKIRDDYFVIATFAFQVIAFSVMNNWNVLTGGPMGLPGIPHPIVFGWTITSQRAFLLLAVSLAGLTLWICRRIVTSPIRRALAGLREDEIPLAAMGKNVFGFKVAVFVVGAALAGLAGVLYADYISFIDPTSFTVMESIFIISIVIIGGAGSLWGPVVGAMVLVTLPELLRFVGMPSSVAANMRQILYGAALVACMMWRPQGLIGEFSFRRSKNS